MDWLERLPTRAREHVEELMRFRQRTLELQQLGRIDREVARCTVENLNRRIERFSEKFAKRSAACEYVPCKRRDPTAWEAIGRIRREEKERRKREAQEKEREADEERSKQDARV